MYAKFILTGGKKSRQRGHILDLRGSRNVRDLILRHQCSIKLL